MNFIFKRIPSLRRRTNSGSRKLEDTGDVFVSAPNLFLDEPRQYNSISEDEGSLEVVGPCVVEEGECSLGSLTQEHQSSIFYVSSVTDDVTSVTDDVTSYSSDDLQGFYISHVILSSRDPPSAGVQGC